MNNQQIAEGMNNQQIAEGMNNQQIPDNLVFEFIGRQAFEINLLRKKLEQMQASAQMEQNGAKKEQAVRIPT